jgi:hypothetical protein
MKQIDPELADLVRVLRRDGVMTRAELLERTGARAWRDQGFNIALRRGVSEGVINKLGSGLFEVGPDAPDLDDARFDPT